MADLGERGQILLIAAFALAVTFVALALVVNSAIFTENLASRGEVSGSSEALVYQHQVVQSVGEAIAFANVYNYSGSLDDSLRASVSEVGNIGGTQSARGGQLVNISYDGNTKGTRIAANDSGGTDFQSNDGRDDWQLAKEVERTRRFKISTTAGDLPGGSPFRVVVNETDTPGNIWRMEVREVSGDLEVTVTTDGGLSKTCEQSLFGVTDVEIDVTGGVVNGERCHALTQSGFSGTPMWYGSAVPDGSDYNISFQNGGAIDGNFSMVIQGPSNPANSSNLELSPTSGLPFETQAIYDATIEYVFVSSNVRYQTEIRVAPGEVPR